jgi:hypothetical protein
MLGDERRVVELELLHSILHLGIFVCLDGKYPSIDIGSDLFESFDRFFLLSWSCEDSISDLGLGDRLESCHDVSDLTLIECLGG